jgi:hypothetical protein
LSSCTIVFRHYLKNGTFYGKNLLKIKYVFWFYIQCLSETFLLYKKWARYDQTSSRSVRVIVKMYNSFSTLFQKWHVLRKKVFENKMCVLIFSTTFVWNGIHYNKNWVSYDKISSRSVRVIVKLYNSYSTLSQKRHDLRKNVIKNKCVFWFSLQRLSETFFIIIRNERDMIKYPRVGLV